MKILVIDNGSKFIKRLLKSLSKHHVDLVDFGEINLKKAESYDKIILSGGSLPVVFYRKEYNKEIVLIKKSKVPILGICLGFELIADAFGEKLVRMNTKEKEVIEAHRIKEDKIMQGLDRFRVFESHIWALKKCNRLIPIAKSRRGIEIIKHPKRKIYGVQFHPEMFHRKTEGLKLLNNFINL